MMRLIAILQLIGMCGVGTWARAQADTSGDPVAVAEREARSGWSARTVRMGDLTVFPYGRVQPAVTCAPLRACVIELETGELVLGKASGDTERWLIEQTGTGPGGKTPLVVIKPTACGLVTNLVVSTDRRVYDVSLVSPPCVTRAGGADAEYTRMIRFYYPDPLLTPNTPGDTRLSSDNETRPEQLRFDYAVHAGKRVRWAPVAVYDDGAHTYLRFPAELAHGPLPVLRALNEGGTPALVNYSVQGDAFVVDRVIERAELVMGNGDGHRVEIVNTRLTTGR